MQFIRFKFYNFIAIIIFVALISFSSGYFFAEPTNGFRFNDLLKTQPSSKVEHSDVDLSLFWAALDKIKEKYINRNDINYESLVNGAVSGMVNSLEDPYTVFFSPEELKKFEEGIDGVFEGIGAEIGIKNNVITIIAPLENSPAQRAGLKAGDKILKIGDSVTVDMTIEQAVEKIRGPKGTSVSLLISREGWEQAKEMNIQREVINVPSFKWSIRDEKIAYIQLFRFGPETGSELRSMAQEIVNSKVDRIVLDLRNNPGGFLETSVEISSLFLPENTLVVSEDYGNGKKDEYKTIGKPILAKYPIVVLVNQGSASASEILAGALRDQEKVTLIGEKTFGKGSVQVLETLKTCNGNSASSSESVMKKILSSKCDVAGLKITIAKWLTPSGKSINDEGLKPDIEVKIIEEPENSEKDIQLDKALEVVKGL